ncbi:hypothetical protein PR048_015896 [Dryococelus australis]|uniref:Uncharacterized protein n=1 Tax=Dryococelus australis TaxID=614101 RepID=A0ABQ9HI73_9NEOP|nr:hypothetical protein PR048_015896 [Dryococelus australis]
MKWGVLHRTPAVYHLRANPNEQCNQELKCNYICPWVIITLPGLTTCLPPYSPFTCKPTSLQVRYQLSHFKAANSPFLVSTPRSSGIMPASQRAEERADNEGSE